MFAYNVKLQRTRFDGLYFGHFGNVWRFVSVEDGRKSVVGPHYASKAELLADLTRYATDYGY